MKKILLSLFVSFVGFIGFSNAVNYDCQNLPNSITVSEDSYILINLYSWNSPNNNLVFFNPNDNSEYIQYGEFGDSFYIVSTLDLIKNKLLAGTYSIYVGGLENCNFDIVPVSSSSSCPTLSGNCTVGDKVSENILFSGSKSFNTSYSNMFNYGDQGAGTYCLKFTSSNPQTLTMGFANGPTTTPTNIYSLYNDQYGNTICLYGNKPYLNVKLNSSSNTINYEVYKLTDLLSDDVPCSTSSCPDCPSCPSLSGYILESDITQDYCEVRYDLITPEDCPVYTGSDFTGEVMWSSFWVNERQIMGGKNIYLYLPDYLNWDYTYVDQNLQIDVENEGDEEYIQSIIDINAYRPTSENFTDIFVSGLTLIMPYIVVVLFIVFIWKLIKKIFK